MKQESRRDIRRRSVRIRLNGHFSLFPQLFTVANQAKHYIIFHSKESNHLILNYAPRPEDRSKLINMLLFPSVSIWRSLFKGSSASMRQPYLEIYTTKQTIFSRSIPALYRSYSTVHYDSTLWPVDLSKSRLELKSHPLG